METKATKLAAITDQNRNQQPQQHPTPPEPAPRAARVAEGAEDQADIRLIIEELDGSYVYKTVDRRTGDIVAQYPREELLKMREEDDYAAGAVIRAKI
jgi:flagellar protein FlaG